MTLINNAKWVGISQFSRVGFQLVGMLLLARLLGPADYGVMAMAMVVVNLANLLRDLGTSAAVVQRTLLDEDEKATIFWLNFGVGILMLALVLTFAAFSGYVFKSEKLPEVLCLLAVSFPISASSAVHQALLERQSRFKLLARIEILSSVFGLCTAIVLAHLKFGVFCLPFQLLAASILSSAQLWIASRWRPAARFCVESFRNMSGYSGNLAVFNFINYLARNSDSMVIGRALGDLQLGIYSQAYRIMLFPLQNMTFVATRALFPVMSRHQDDPSMLRALYMKTVMMVVAVTGPLMGGIWVLRAEFVQVVFGDRWSPVIPVLAWLAPVGFLQSIVSTTGVVFMATGQTNKLMKLGLIATFLQVGAFVIGSRWDVTHVAAMYCFANVINFFVAMNATMKELKSSLMFLMRQLVWPVLACAIMLACIKLLREQLVYFGEGDLCIALLVSLAGVAVYGISGFRWIKRTIFTFRT